VFKERSIHSPAAVVPESFPIAPGVGAAGLPTEPISGRTPSLTSGTELIGVISITTVGPRRPNSADTNLILGFEPR
jgi:hypothetical protein